MPVIDVYNPLGVKIGLLQDLVVDLRSGQVRYVIVWLKFSGLDSEERILPWSVFVFNPDLGGFQTYVTEAQVQKAPPFDRGSAHAMEWEPELKVFYGVVPINPHRGDEPQE